MFFQDHLALFPKFKIVCETEEHFGFINLRPKESYQNSAGYAEIDKELFQLTGNRIRYIETTDTNGSGRYVYNRPANLALDRENSRKTRISLATNHSKKAIFLVSSRFSGSVTTGEIERVLGEFAQKFFTDQRGKALIICGIETESGISNKKDPLKKTHHQSYKAPRPEAQASPIEKIFKDELIRRGITFKEQVNIERKGAEFTRPDFYIESARLMIYCDGTEFHKDPQRIIMDKQQDRYLQSQGYTVLRFSGSEIFSHVDTCVNEVMQFLKKK
ncbi:MAG TPA: DUF559 domain-containing protein [Candidatus Rifleibacterium sp.]|nr:DUF559 domain-containing protein [Candidatus Rifleibacterium sp.]HPT47182.1 DUF559 domain-containing protein [Candidatus Rifleibacterium sp.]